MCSGARGLGLAPGSGGVSVGPDCGILGLSSSWFAGFLGVCVGLSVIFIYLFFALGMQGFFSHFVDFFSFLVWGLRGSQPWGWLLISFP